MNFKTGETLCVHWVTQTYVELAFSHLLDLILRQWFSALQLGVIWRDRSADSESVPETGADDNNANEDDDDNDNDLTW